MVEMRMAHTAEVDAVTLEAAHELLSAVFEGGFTADDWEHSLGGMHALVYEDGELVGHGSVVQRRLLHAGRVLRCGYLEGVGVRADRRGRGHARAIIESLEAVIRGAYDLGALSATDMAAPIYAARGWQLWRGPTSALTPGGIARTPQDDDSVYVLPVAADLDLDGEITCDWREGDVW